MGDLFCIRNSANTSIEPFWYPFPPSSSTGMPDNSSSLGVELHGLWLQSDELAKRLLHSDLAIYTTLGPVAFVPFAQIASILFATRQPTPAEAPAASQPKSGAKKVKIAAKARPHKNATNTRQRAKSG